MFAANEGVTPNDKLYVDDVFSTYLYTGNGSTQTINNGIDLAGKGGLVWIKNRANDNSNVLFDSERSNFQARLVTNGTQSSFIDTAMALQNISSTGFQLSSSVDNNTGGSGFNYVSWTFRKAPKFFDVVTYTGNGVAGRQIPHNLGVAPGIIIVKRTDTTGYDWAVYHRSTAETKVLYLNNTNAEQINGMWNNTVPTSTNFSVAGSTFGSVNASGGTYVAYLWAHDPSADGIIQCGSISTLNTDRTVTLGWEPQGVFMKSASIAGSNWMMYDNMRGMDVNGSVNVLMANLSNAESSSQMPVIPTATGFIAKGASAPVNGDWVYLAIRRPNKPPTTGTEVYNAIARTGTSANATITSAGFPPDLLAISQRNDPGAGFWFHDRLRGANLGLKVWQTAAEIGYSTGVLSLNQDGYSIGSVSEYLDENYTGKNYINHFFRRAAGFYDQVCYNGTGSNKTEPHTLLGVAPELWRAKRRNGSGSWVYGSSLLNANEKILMPSPNGRVTDATVWNSAYPTATQFSLGTHADVNAAGGTYIMEMWATLNGVSKVGAYTGNGGSQTIDCGFGTGARFIKIIRMTAGVAQNIYIWDTERGIVAANDPHLSLNTADPEVTTNDSVDPDSSGFIVNQNTTTNINVSGASYIFLAIA